MKKKAFILILLIVTILTGCSVNATPQFISNPSVIPTVTPIITATPTNVTVEQPRDELQVHFIDVGQADCILVKTNDNTMLIDSGNNEDSETIINYLQELDVEKIDVVIATHPHEDHIGSMDEIINNFSIGEIHIAKAPSNTKTFEDMLLAIKKKELKVKIAEANTIIDFDSDMYAKILAPGSFAYASNDINNASVVLEVSYNHIDFLFAGDAEKTSEFEMINQKYNLDVEVLKVGHHGSESSTSEQFIKATTPKYAVISVGENNKYGHPDKDTINNLENAGAKVYRTDLDGTIVMTTDGYSIEVKNNKVINNTEIQPKEKVTSKEEVGTKVYVTKTGTKYHRGSCSCLSASKIEMELQNAIGSGYEPCSRCKP